MFEFCHPPVGEFHPVVHKLGGGEEGRGKGKVRGEGGEGRGGKEERRGEGERRPTG